MGLWSGQVPYTMVDGERLCASHVDQHGSDYHLQLFWDHLLVLRQEVPWHDVQIVRPQAVDKSTSARAKQHGGLCTRWACIDICVQASGLE